MYNYDESWEEIRRDGPRYWAKKMERYTWFTPWEKIVEEGVPYCPKWFVGGKLNLCYDCLDRKVKDGYGDKIAYIFDSAVTNKVTYYTYNDILSKVSRLAKVLVDCGIKVGDNVLLYLPSIIETLISILAVSRIGAVFNVLQGDYSDEAIASRIDDTKVKVAIVSNGQLVDQEILLTKLKLDRSIDLANHKISKCIVLQRPQFPLADLDQLKDLDFNEAINAAQPQDCIPVEANSNLLILFTSGTTGKPKGIVLSVRSVAVSIVLDDGQFLGVDECKLSYVGSSYAWITGLMFNCFMPLLFNITSFIFESATSIPNVKDIYRILSEHKIETYFTPTCVFRILKQQDPFGLIANKYKPFFLKKLYSGAVPGDADILDWVKKTFNLLAPQIYGSTETGGLITTCNFSMGRSLDDEPILSSLYSIPGHDVRIMREDGIEAEPNEVGEIVLKAPFCPSIATTVLMNHDLFIKSYFLPYPGYFDMKDYGKLDEKGRLYVYSRSDDVFKAGGGNKISCGAIEEVILNHTNVSECVVVTKMGDDHGSEIHIPIPFIILRKDLKCTDNFGDEVVDMVHRDLGNFIPIEKPIIIDNLPRTLSGKLQRGIIKKLLSSSENELLKIDQPELQSLKSALLGGCRDNNKM